MENDWEILDQFEWVKKAFVELRIFNNFINMLIWTFWTWAIGYAIWLFCFTKQMDFFCYYVFLYSMYINVFGLVFLHDYWYFSDRFRRDKCNRLRIQDLNDADEWEQTQLERPEVIRQAKRWAKRMHKYPQLKPFFEIVQFDARLVFFLVHLEEKKQALELREAELLSILEKQDQEDQEMLSKINAKKKISNSEDHF